MEQTVEEAKNGGERGIRTPGGFHLFGFQDRRLKPLDHLSAKIRIDKKACANNTG